MSRAAPRASRLRITIAELPYSALNAGLERGDQWATKFLIATARVLAQRLAALNKETIAVMAQLEKSKSKAPRKMNWKGFGADC